MGQERKSPFRVQLLSFCYRKVYTHQMLDSNCYRIGMDQGQNSVERDVASNLAGTNNNAQTGTSKYR